MRHVYKVVLALLVTVLQTYVFAQASCTKPVYLTFDTGHMGVANLVSDVLAKHDVKASFFLANEKTKTGGTSLDEFWTLWWNARASEGHVFGSHTLDHVYWQADTSKGFRVKATAGKASGKVQEWTPEQYCAEIRRAEARFFAMTGQSFVIKGGKKLFRAPGGKTSFKLLQAIEACGYRHMGWSVAGFLGDELPSDKFPNHLLLEKALTNIKQGDILMAHLGIWSRKDPWVPAVLEPLIVGLKARGFCFETLADKAK
jgi:peptidoglycan-N-acetylmuramic acid deacetylase